MNKVLVIGGGGREHAIIHALSKSYKVGKIYAAPGNAGIAALAECVDIKDDDVEGLFSFAKSNSVDLTIVGPELPLSLGIVDRFKSDGLNIFGPTKAAAQIETSKVFAKDLMSRYSIPTAYYKVFDNYYDAVGYLRDKKFPLVIKYEGLAAGKGVVVAESFSMAENALKDMLLYRKFGRERVIIEEFLDGDEFSFMCFVSGNKVSPMPLAQDHKRAFDGDEGPNTGGMGAYSPLMFMSDYEIEWAYKNIMCAAASALVKEGIPFCGVLYGGLIKTDSGIKVVEFNARFGDPETEIVLPLLDSDVYDLFNSVVSGEDLKAKWINKASFGVVCAAKGYPSSYSKGFYLNGLENLGSYVYHMGTVLGRDNRFVSNGGRVFIVTDLSDSLYDARNKVYAELNKMDNACLFYRKDIGWRALK